MIQKKTGLTISDNTNVCWLRVFHLYKGFFKKKMQIGFFAKGSARVVEPPRLEYKGFKVKFNRKGDICRGIFVRAKYNNYKQNGAVTYASANAAVLIKKKQDLKSRYLYGPIIFTVKRKKFLLLFQKMI